MDSLGCFGIRNSDKFILHFNQVCFQIYGMALQQAFQGRVISRLTAIPWPSKSSDLSCLDYWFWGVAMQEIRRSKPSTLTELKRVVESFAERMDQEEVVKSARHLRKRAKA